MADVSPAPRRKVSRQPPHRRPWRGTTINKWFRNAICVRARMPECVSHRALQPCGNINRDRDREGGKLERVSHTPRVFLTPGTAGSWHSDELLHDNFTATLVYPMLRKPIPRAVGSILFFYRETTTLAPASFVRSRHAGITIGL